MIRTKGLTLFSCYYFSHEISQIYSIWECGANAGEPAAAATLAGKSIRVTCCASGPSLMLLHLQTVTPFTATSPAALARQLHIPSGTLGNLLQVPHSPAFKQKINLSSFKSSSQKRMTMQGGVLVPQVFEFLFTIKVLPNTVIKLRTLRKENLHKRGWN